MTVRLEFYSASNEILSYNGFSGKKNGRGTRFFPFLCFFDYQTLSPDLYPVFHLYFDTIIYSIKITKSQYP